MGAYSLEAILLAWKTEKLTTEQAVGQILQLLQELDRRLVTLEKAAATVRAAATSPPHKTDSKA